MTLLDRIRAAQQAQQDHAQKHDTQLALLPFVPEIEWATDNEYRDEWHRKFDDDWREWIHAHYDHEG